MVTKPRWMKSAIETAVNMADSSAASPLKTARRVLATKPAKLAKS